jgi:2-dehydro-3-deoxyphosphogluconate aldolase/(4S)-4-hydroxy-2-oxoglutarate aldolase
LKLTVPVVGILRGIEPRFFGDVMERSFAAGLEAIEITMNTRGAEEAVRNCREAVPSGKLLGMGTVRNVDEAERALEAGAMFLVTPNTDERVLAHAASRGVPVVTGALTPTEVYAAAAGGAAMVKVFPCQALGGPRYIAELRGPFEAVPLMAVGGVSAGNAREYFTAGADAVGVGASLFGEDALRDKDLSRLGENVSDFIRRCQRDLETG